MSRGERRAIIFSSFFVKPSHSAQRSQNLRQEMFGVDLVSAAAPNIPKGEPVYEDFIQSTSTRGRRQLRFP